MTTEKPINLAQLQDEAVALNAGHTFFSMATTTPTDEDGITPAGAELYCSGEGGTLTDVCPAGQRAYDAHRAVPTNGPNDQRTRDIAALRNSDLDPEVRDALFRLLGV